MSAAGWIVMLHAFATVAMTGLIWFVQVVHYPLFASVGEAGFERYEAAHVRRTTWVVAPLMLAELASAGWLAVWPPTPGSAWAVYLGFALLLVVWLSTALGQIPCHRRLEGGLDLGVVRRLVATNWIRTVAWTARALVALYLVGQVGPFGAAQ